MRAREHLTLMFILKNCRFRVSLDKFNLRPRPPLIMPKRKASKKDDSVKKVKSENESSELAPTEQPSNTEFNFDQTVEANGKMSTLKIISWNVNGIRAVLKNKAMQYLNAESCDVLCFQETKCSDKDFPIELKNWKEFPFKYYCASEQIGYAGVAMFCKQKPTSVEYGLGEAKHDAEGRIITAHFDDFILVNAYIPNAGRGLKRLDYRMEFDGDLLDYLKNLDKQKPVILCGDLNVSHKEIDLENPKTNVKNAGFTPEERANFTTLLENGFVDSFRHFYADKPKCYTFWSYMRNARAKNIGWRLDYFVASERLMSRVCDNQIRSEVMGSDHAPIVLYLANSE